MPSQYSLIFTKEKNSSSCDSEADFGVVCLDGMPVPSYETKDVYVNDWHDEHGLEVYDSDNSMLKATEISIPMGVKGDGAGAAYGSFLMWLATNGRLMTVNCPYTGFTLHGVEFRKADPEPPGVYDGEYIMQFKLTLRITKPNE